MKNQKSVFEVYAHEYDLITNAAQRETYHAREVAALIERFNPKSVLDAGCGAGVPVTRVLGQRCNAIGLDFAEAQLRLARQLVQGVCFACQDMTRLGFPDDTFDAICSCYAVIHVPRIEHRRLLLEFHRVLRPGSLMLVCMGLGDLENDVAHYCGAPMYWSHYDGETNLRLIQRCGFEVIWSRPVQDGTDDNAAHLFVLARKT